jgi:outer membrane protein
MFKKVIIALAIAVALPVVAAAQKFGVVDVNTIFAAMPESTAAQNQLAEASKKYEEEWKKIADEVDKKVQEYQALDASTPESIKERRMQEVQELDAKATKFRQTAQEDLQKQQQQLTAPIEQKLFEAIKAVGQENGFTFIFPEGVAAYQGSDVVDATPLVKAKLGLK